MGNSYFQFKQFIIHQDACAMKVCTDACIEGAWLSARIAPAASVLDIGSGTGLLMLMLAQRHDGRIQGIELDEAAFKQCRQNLADSPWKDRLEVLQGDVRSFSFDLPLPGKFDFIITNPPFYEDDLHADSHAKNLARHSKMLTLEELIDRISACLNDNGRFGILLPYHRMSYFEELATTRQFHLLEKLLIKQTPGHDPFRVILLFGRDQDNREQDSREIDARDQHPRNQGTETKGSVLYQGDSDRDAQTKESVLVIKDGPGKEYTAAFTALLKDYYLYL